MSRNVTVHNTEKKKKDCTCMVIGDPHFKFQEFYLQRVEEMGEKFIALCKERKPDFIVNLGDTLHDHRKIDMLAQCKAVCFLRELSKIAPLFILIGNHDRVNNSDFLSTVSPFEALKDWKNTYIVDQPYTLTFHTFDKVFSFYFVPYVAPKRFQEALSLYNIDVEKFTMGFGHQEFFGSKMGAFLSEEGDVWPYDKPIVCGHIHDSQLVRNQNGKEYINYVGTPIGHSHGEHGLKTVSLFHMIDSAQALITQATTFWCKSDTMTPNQANLETNIYEEKIELNLKRLRTVKIDAKKFLNYEMDTKKEDPRYFRFVIEGSDYDVKMAKKSDKFHELENLGCKIHFPVTQFNTTTNNNVETNGEPDDGKNGNGNGKRQIVQKSFEQCLVEKLEQLPDELVKLYQEIISDT